MGTELANCQTPASVSAVEPLSTMTSFHEPSKTYLVRETRAAPSRVARFRLHKTIEISAIGESSV
jgi:hypothetical protein